MYLSMVMHQKLITILKYQKIQTIYNSLLYCVSLVHRLILHIFDFLSRSFNILKIFLFFLLNLFLLSFDSIFHLRGKHQARRFRKLFSENIICLYIVCIILGLLFPFHISSSYCSSSGGCMCVKWVLHAKWMNESINQYEPV